MTELLRDRYEALSEAWAGGEATVFKARDHLHDRFVALKVRTIAHDDDRSRLVAEAGILLSLEPHSQLPTVRDDFFVDDRYVIVMDWIDGIDLDEVLDRHGRPGLPLTTAMNYLAQVAAALTHLHGHDPPVVHGDVKPANLILNEQGKVILVDFGLSVRGDGNGRYRFGTVKYVAPEVASGQRAGLPSDVYSLAATAHTLITGQPPTGMAMDLTDIDPVAAAAVGDAIQRGLALDPSRRPASPGEFVERLRSGWQSTLPTGVTTFLLTDIVGSSALWDAHPAAMSVALVRHDSIVTQAVEEAGGRLIKSMGEGDSTVSVFPRADAGVAAALAANRALAQERWPDGVTIRIRSALHTGLAELRDAQYFGPTLNRTARLRALAEAGEVLVSSVVAELVAPNLPHDCALVDLGVHGLPGLGEPERVHGVMSPVTETPPLSVCPYRGLARYEAHDSALFFGRREAVAAALGRLDAHPFLAVIGASGSGKSSLVEAGIVPALLAREETDLWKVDLVVPGLDDDVGRGADDVVGRRRRRLVVVDPLERLFTQCPDPADRAAFIARVLSVADLVIVVLRADFYGECASVPGFADAVANHQLLLGPMTDDELRDAVDGPAVASRLQLEPGLADLIIDDVAGEPGALPLLSHALMETWARRSGRKLTIAGYRAAGGVRGAIARTADAVHESLDRHSQDLVRRVFLRLVEPGDDAQDTRRKAPLIELHAAAGGDDVDAVVEELVGARLVTLDADGVEVAHEALIREWPRLRGWLEEARDDLRAHRHLARSARAWLEAGRDPAELYRGARLLAGERLDRATMSPSEIEFLDASRLESEREQQALRDRVDQQHRANRRLRRLLIGLAVVLLLAIVSASAAVVQRDRAGHEADLARAANRVSSEQLARGLASSALQLAPSDPYLATVLASEAMARFEPVLPEARSALVESRVQLAGRRLVPYGDPLSVGDAQTVVMRPGTDMAMVGNRNGTIDVWSLRSRQRLEQLTGPDGGIQRMSFTSDGRWLVAGSDDGRIWRWPADRRDGDGDTREGRVLLDTGAVVWAVAAAPTGRTVAAVTQAGDLFLVDAGSGQPVGESIHAPDALMSVAFSPDGASLVAGSLEGSLYGWSLDSRGPLFEPVRAHGGLVWDLVIAPGGPTIISTSTDGTVKLWDLRTGGPVPGPLEAPQPLGVGSWGSALSREGDIVWFAGRDGAVYSWSFSTRLVERAAVAHRGEIRALAGSPGARLLTTLGEDRTIQVWTDRPRAGPVTVIAREPDRPSALAVSPRGGVLAFATERDDVVRLVDSTTGEGIAIVEAGAGVATALTFPTETSLAIGTSEGSLSIWEIRGDRVRRVADGNLPAAVAVSALASSIETSPPMLVVAGTDRRLRRLETSTLEEIGDPTTALGSPVTDVALAPGGGSFAAATQQGAVARWDAGGNRLETFTVTDDVVWGIAFGAADTLGTVSADEVLTLWSTSNGRLSERVRSLGRNPNGALDIAFIDTSTVLATAADGQVRIWDVDSGAPIGPALAIAEKPARLVVATSDGTFWAAADDGTVSRVDALVLKAACDAAAESFDDQQRSRLLAGRPQVGCDP